MGAVDAAGPADPMDAAEAMYQDDLEPLVEVEASDEEAYAANRDNWDGRARVHASSRVYGVDVLAADPTRSTSVAGRDLQLLGPHLPDGSLEGLDLCHLQCHIGTDTLSFARRGARCTGVDLSPVSLQVATDLAVRAGQSIRYVEANVLDAADAVGERFDVVYTSTGTICWIHDLGRWAEQVAALMRPGAVFFLRDSHPFVNAMADDDASVMDVQNRYFPLAQGRAHTYEDTGTYTDGDTSAITQPRNYAWPHSVGEILGSLLGAGLRLVEVSEQDDLPWPVHPSMRVEGDAFVLPSPWREQVPVALTVVARAD